MSNLSKPSTIYFEPNVYQALKVRSLYSEVSVSEIIDEAVRLLLREDDEDLEDISKRAIEPEKSYEELLNDLQLNSKL